MSDSFFPHLADQDGNEDSHWRSFVDVMMLIVIIFMLIMVAVVMTNTKLLDDLKHSVISEKAAQVEAKQAAQLAESSLQKSASMEDQLQYYQQHSSDLEMELLSSRAQAEAAQTALSSKDSELQRLQTMAQEQASSLASRDQTLNGLQAQLAAKSSQDAQLKQVQSDLSGAKLALSAKEDENAKLHTQADRLASLQGEFEALDKKYQKLLRPARSPKGKQVVEVVYQSGGYTVRKPGEAAARAVGRDALDSELGGLKAQYGTDLYVKVIIPDNSGLSYNEAWRFTNDMLTHYDYYSQPDSSVPAKPSP